MCCNCLARVDTRTYHFACCCAASCFKTLIKNAPVGMLRGHTLRGNVISSKFGYTLARRGPMFLFHLKHQSDQPENELLSTQNNASCIKHPTTILFNVKNKMTTIDNGRLMYKTISSMSGFMATCWLFQPKLNAVSICYNEAVRQRRDYKEKPKEAKPLTRNAKRLLLDLGFCVSA